MREQNYGRIVNTSSGSGLFGNFGQSNYGAAKAGLMGLTRVLSIEGERNNVRVNAIAPIAHTRMTEDQIDETMGPELISPFVAYLCHASCEITGQAYSVGGGRVSRLFLGMTTGITEPDLTAEMIAERIAEIEDPARVRDPLVSRRQRRRGARVRGRPAPCSSSRLRCTLPDAVSGNGSSQMHELLGDLPLRRARRPPGASTIASNVRSAPGRGADRHRQPLAGRAVGDAVARALRDARQRGDHAVDLG